MPRLKNPCWEAFCVLFMGKHRGNRTLAYSEAFDKKITNTKTYHVCQTAGSRLLLNVVIIERCRELMDKSGITAEKLDSKLLFLLDQMEDYKTSMLAIKEGNVLLGRTNQNKVQVNILNYEQLLINAGAITSQDGGTPEGHGAVLPRVQKALPEDQRQEQPAYNFCPKPSTKEVGKDNDGPIIEGEAIEVDSSES